MNRFGFAILGVAMLFGCSDDNNNTPDSPTTPTIDAAHAIDGSTSTADASTIDAGGAAVFRVTASQANETGPSEPCANAAAGAAATSTVTVSADNSTVTVTNITFTSLSGKPVMGHLHFGATGVAGPIVFGFQNLPSADSGTGTIPDQTFTATGFTPPSGITDFADAVSKLKAGMFYMNLHTSMCGSGEVRGQVLP